MITQFQILKKKYLYFLIIFIFLGLNLSYSQETALIQDSLTVEKEKKKSAGFSFSKGVKAKEILIFCKQFSTMLRSGMPVLNALNLLIDQTTSPNMKKIIEQIKKDLEGGNALSKCFENHPKTFDTVTVNLIKAGEASGKLDTFLERIDF